MARAYAPPASGSCWELGLAGAAAFQLFLACNVLSALIHPIYLAALCYYLFAQPPEGVIAAMGGTAPLFAATLIAGYASAIALDLIGLQRRGLLAHAWVLLLTPLYWLLLSLAAWRALFQLLSAPSAGRRPSMAWPRTRASTT